MAKLPHIQLPNTLKERLVQGHPWVYRNHVPAQMHFPSGTWVRAQCGNWTGYGLWDANGPIAIRIFSEQQLPTPQWLREQVGSAWDLRLSLREKGCTAYRWLFGEGDGLPGLTVDLYGQFAVIQTYMEGATALQDWLIDALKATTSLQGIYLRTQHRNRESIDNKPEPKTGHKPEPKTENQAESKVELLWGKPAPTDLVVIEHGLNFQVNLQAGQKTGLFLDHRENRRFIEGLSQDRDVLNCFAYTGAFSLYALRGKARQVTSVDIGKGLAEAASTNIALNQLDSQRHTFVTQDCFNLLNSYVEQGRRFDLLILDPPSFAKSKQNRHAAQRAYTKLNALALRCVAPGGLLATASCTSQISTEAFKEAIAAAGASAGRRFQIIHEAGQPVDHPVPAQFPEGRYLKFVVGRVR
ncbi:class I SAM-dependent rRNA methyltransferase [Leptolyngbya sp. FACHB-261]|uniref:class I SAM-dependent rRNA methyltransferase n=1 Tax=Leptolyngbya sp. FACHB-261 TaxID=2692806 RepID=UPI001682AE24|nr:class I SAM-dependent rRNA methyltransferase [Leptolyngbya sp. FACHB-261]MBD2099790.1 class I SAM-dependent rRNA methyltransferase [Leptolyngbya sp. FACHB-261]